MKTETKEILSRYPAGERNMLIPVLQEFQETFGYLSRENMIAASEYLNVPVSKIYGVATFYNQFSFSPKGRNHILLCRGTACHVKGSLGVLERLEQLLGIKAGETTKDGQFSIEVVACIGACGLAPVVSINGEFHAKMTPDSLDRLVAQYKQGGK
ncbi:MAG: NADH-quinone oxidoreductase subunit NuoE [Elusimicrobiaceae bacterium]|nr:NADH-quinone oxidoreductase subunit NuoE [Elusimicrobiaceae bacterium]